MHALPERGSIIPNYNILGILSEQCQMIKSEKEYCTSNIYLNSGIQEKCVICENLQQFGPIVHNTKRICDCCRIKYQASPVLLDDLKCLKNHQLVQHSLVKKKTILCVTCNRLIKDFKAECLQCNISICEECIKTIRLLLININHLRCTCSEEITWKWYASCDRCSQCSSSYTRFGVFFCISCQKKYCVSCASSLKYFYYCKSCKNSFEADTKKIENLVSHQNICETCLKSIESSDLATFSRQDTIQSVHSRNPLHDIISINKQSKKLKEICNNHELNTHISTNQKCSICKIQGKDFWTCSNCKYFMCNECKKWYEKSYNIDHPLIRDYHNHYLRKTQNAEKFYNRNGAYLCDGCQLSVSGDSCHCKECKVDYCNRCIILLTTLLRKSTDIICKCNLKITWDYSYGRMKCHQCNRKFNKCGAFCCGACNHNYCIDCTYALQSKKCCICLLYSDNLCSFIIINCGHNMCVSCFSKLSAYDRAVCPYDGFNLQVPASSIPNCSNLEIKYIKSIIIINKNSIRNIVKARSLCDSCKKKNQELWIFDYWNYALCNTCIAWYENTEMLEEPLIKCTGSHYLRKNYIADYVLCDGCKVKFTAFGYSCKGCKIDYCLKCVNLLIFVIQNLFIFSCNCSGELIWKFNKPLEKCSLCNRKFDKSGTFLCCNCNNNYCLKCAFSLKNPACQKCKKLFENTSNLTVVDADKIYCDDCFKIEFPETELLLKKTDYSMLKYENILKIGNFMLLVSQNLKKLKSLVHCEHLSFKSIMRNNESCEVCKIKSQGIWCCNMCSYFVCNDCKKWIENSEFLEETGLNCIKNHKLRCQRFSYQISNDFFCNGCNSNTTDERVTCKCCGISFCSICISLLKILLKTPNRNECKCKRELIWRYDIPCETCSSCSMKFIRSGSFYCIPCNLTFCIRCSYFSTNILNSFQ